MFLGLSTAPEKLRTKPNVISARESVQELARVASVSMHEWEKLGEGEVRSLFKELKRKNEQRIANNFELE